MSNLSSRLRRLEAEAVGRYPRPVGDVPVEEMTNEELWEIVRAGDARWPARWQDVTDEHWAQIDAEIKAQRAELDQAK